MNRLGRISFAVVLVASVASAQDRLRNYGQNEGGYDRATFDQLERLASQSESYDTSPQFDSRRRDYARRPEDAPSYPDYNNVQDQRRRGYDNERNNNNNNDNVRDAPVNRVVNDERQAVIADIDPESYYPEAQPKSDDFYYKPSSGPAYAPEATSSFYSDDLNAERRFYPLPYPTHDGGHHPTEQRGLQQAIYEGANAFRPDGVYQTEDRLDFHISGHEGPHSYRYGYDTGHGYNRQFRYEERDKHGYVKGRYGFFDRYGKLQLVNYSADPHDGFHAEGAHVPHFPH